jgi:peptidoglycan biosynthesis protein MviN/MurJ (putative lipid II flippase)
MLTQIAVALVAMGAAIYAFTPELDVWQTWSVLRRILTLPGLILLGAIIYPTVLMLTGLKPGKLVSNKE